jgi:transposase
MNHIGIDLHRNFMMVCVLKDSGEILKPRRLECRDVHSIKRYFSVFVPFRAVIEASSSYRWLYELLSPLGEVVLAHPLKLRAIVTARAKTDKLDCELLAKLLKSDLIPRSYVPPKRYQELRDITRARARLMREASRAACEISALLGKSNLYPPYNSVFTRKGLLWLSGVDFGNCGNAMRDELVHRIEYFRGKVDILDEKLAAVADEFPEVAAISDIRGIGLYSALLIIAEVGEPERFKNAKQVGCYAGLTTRVYQSGESCHHGNISKQGSSWLRWILVQAAMKAVKDDDGLRNFYIRIRKRSSARIARVAVARKLACIIWFRLVRWFREQRAA